MQKKKIIKLQDKNTYEKTIVFSYVFLEKERVADDDVFYVFLQKQ
jgi:hypothetical protein